MAVEAKNALAALEADPATPARELEAKTLALQLAEQKAADAMKECEMAMKEEMQAQAVVKVGDGNTCMGESCMGWHGSASCLMGETYM